MPAKSTKKPAPNKSTAKSPAKPALGSRLSWDELAALRNHALTPDFLAHQLVGTSVFPDLPTDFEGFERSVKDPVLPATHELYSSAGEATYRVFYHQRGPDEDYKDHGKAAFKALTAAITTLHGKSTGGGNARAWETADREIELNLYFSSGDPYGADLRLRVRPRSRRTGTRLAGEPEPG